MDSEPELNSFIAGAFLALVVVVCVTQVMGCSDMLEGRAANTKCQQLGFSAAHYEKEAGLVCEQWIEAAKVQK